MSAASTPLAVDLVRASDPLDRWLWCLCCERFFQVKHLAYDAHKIERCAFGDCIGAGLDRDIFLWDAWRDPADPRWPRHARELRHGMRSPETASLCQQLSRARAGALIGGFARSPEFAALRREGGPRWSEELVEKLSWWGVQPADVDAEYLGRTLRDFGYWVSCRATDAGEITRELTAFFAYGARALGWSRARACALFLTDAAVTRELERTIRRYRQRRRR